MLTVPLLQVLRWWLIAGYARSVTWVSFVSFSKKHISQSGAKERQGRTLFDRIPLIEDVRLWLGCVLNPSPPKKKKESV